MKFPFSERDLKELNLISEEDSPLLEDLRDIFSEHYTEITQYSKLGELKEEFLSKELKYDENGMMTSRKMWNRKGELWRQTTGRLEGNKYIMESSGNKDFWIFNENGILIKAIYGYQQGYEINIDFKLDEFQNPIQIDDRIEIKWEDGFPKEARDIKKNVVLTQIEKRTPTETVAYYPSVANQDSAKEPRYFTYEKYGRLISDIWGAWKTETKFFGYDMMVGKDITKYLRGAQMWKHCEEETLIDRNLVENKSNYQEKGQPKKYYREIKKMKVK